MKWLRRLTGRAAAESDAAPDGSTPLTPEPVASTLVVIDVRTEREFKQGAVQGAVNLPLDRLADGIRRVAPDMETRVVLYCATGGRSGMGLAMLHGMGYRNVENAGGVFAAAACLSRGVR